MFLVAACGSPEEPAVSGVGEEQADPSTPAPTDDVVEEDPAEPQQDPTQLRFASFAGPNIGASQYIQAWAEEVEQRSGGSVSIEFYFSEALLPGAESIRGVADGRADLGYTANAYHPADLPMTSVVELPFVTADGWAQTMALEELYATYEPYQQEWRSQGVHLLFVPLSTDAVIGTKEPIGSLEDLQGLQIRAIGRMAAAFDRIGANPVAIPFPEVYESVARGVIDGYTSITFDTLTGAGFHEVAPYVTYPGIGNYIQDFVFINLDLWESFPEDVRAVLESTAREMLQDDALPMLAAVHEEACDRIVDAGGSVSRLPEEEIEGWRAEVQDELLEAWFADAAEHDFDAQAWYEAYTESLAAFETQSEDYVPGVLRCIERQS